MGGEPLLPVGVIRKVRAREALGRAGCIALRNPLGVLPAERRERDDACVQPDVADLGHASYLLAARLATDRHVVDPWAVQLLELVEPRRRAFFQLRLRPDHVRVPAGAEVDREREAEVTLARDVPVAMFRSQSSIRLP